jgi:signal transduction histidine kinase
MVRRNEAPSSIWQRVKFLCFCVVIAAYGVILSMFVVRTASPATLPGDWSFQFPLLLLTSAGLSVPVFFLRQNGRLKTSLFILQTLFCLILGYLEGDNAWMELLFLVVLVTESMTQFRFRQGITVAVVILTVVIILQKPVLAWDVRLPGVPIYNITAFGFCGFLLIIFMAVVRYLARKLDEGDKTLKGLHGSVMQLMAANMVFQHYASTVEDKALINERNRITRDIHDSVGYTLMNLAMMLEASRDLSRRDKREELETMLVRAKDQVKEAIKETRATLHILRTDEGPPSVGVRAINKLITTFAAATDVIVDIEYGNAPWSFGEEVDAVVYRMVQEGLANAFRHGKATRVAISLWVEHNEVSLQVYDNGKGFIEGPTREGIGLQGMRERVEPRGGRIRFSGDEMGCKLSAWIPLERDKE